MAFQGRRPSLRRTGARTRDQKWYLPIPNRRPLRSMPDARCASQRRAARCVRSR